MFKFQLPLQKGTEVFPHTSIGPAVVRTTIEIPAVERDTDLNRRDLERAARQIISERSGSLLHFVQAQRQIHAAGIVDYSKKRAQFPGIDISWASVAGQEYIELTVYPQVPTVGEKPLYLLIFHEENKITAVKMTMLDNPDKWTADYQHVLQRSSWGTDPIKLSQYKFSNPAPVVCSPLYVEENRVHLGDVHYFTHLSSELKRFLPTTTPAARTPHMNGGQGSYFTPNDTFITQVTAQGSQIVHQGEVNAGVYPVAISSEGVYYYAPVVWAPSINIVSSDPYEQTPTPLTEEDINKSIAVWETHHFDGPWEFRLDFSAIGTFMAPTEWDTFIRGGVAPGYTTIPYTEYAWVPDSGVGPSYAYAVSGQTWGEWHLLWSSRPGGAISDNPKDYGVIFDGYTAIAIPRTRQEVDAGGTAYLAGMGYSSARPEDAPKAIYNLGSPDFSMGMPVTVLAQDQRTHLDSLTVALEVPLATFVDAGSAQYTTQLTYLSTVYDHAPASGRVISGLDVVGTSGVVEQGVPDDPNWEPMLFDTTDHITHVWSISFPPAYSTEAGGFYMANQGKLYTPVKETDFDLSLPPPNQPPVSGAGTDPLARNHPYIMRDQYKPWLHASNGRHSIQAFELQGERYIYLDRKDVKAAIEKVTKTTIDKVQTLMMDVPLPRIKQLV